MPALGMASLSKEAPVDFYAGVIAAAVVLLFAKFVTHGMSHEKWHGLFTKPKWHKICVWLALLSLMGSLIALGWPTPQSSAVETAELILRAFIGFFVLLATFILAVDVLSLDGGRLDAGHGSTPSNTNDATGPRTVSSARDDCYPNVVHLQRGKLISLGPAVLVGFIGGVLIGASLPRKPESSL